VRLILLAIAPLAVFAQTTPSAGLEPTWDVAVILEEIGKDTAALRPMLDQVDGPGWIQKGASSTYLEQVQSSKDQAGAIVTEAHALARNPEKLSSGLELYFRLQGLETMLGSVEEAMRKYQTPQLAEDLSAAFARFGANRERFRNYIIQLAADREHQFEVMDQEAQRCRALLMAAPQPAKTKPATKKK
jgi:hypothetical protein